MLVPTLSEGHLDSGARREGGPWLSKPEPQFALGRDGEGWEEFDWFAHNNMCGFKTIDRRCEEKSGGPGHFFRPIEGISGRIRGIGKV